MPQHKSASDIGYKVLTAQGWLYNFRLSRFFGNVWWISFCGFIKVGNVH